MFEESIISENEVSLQDPKDFSVGEILKKTRENMLCRIEKDLLPITVAIVDPKKVKIGVTIQGAYPLTKIERSYGVPFGKLRNDDTRIISNADQLHACKWNMGAHILEFETDEANEEFIRTRDHKNVISVLSTGIGNILQNKRSVAYIKNSGLYMVTGETLDTFPPYTCFVSKFDSSTHQDEFSLELLSFSDKGLITLYDKERYRVSRELVASNMQNNVNWAVSGYPLVVNRHRVSLEEVAENASDYRHIWLLPRLENSIARHIRPMIKGINGNKNVEFYFGFDTLPMPNYKVRATQKKAIDFPLLLPATNAWISTLCHVCGIKLEELKSSSIYSPEGLKYNPEDLEQDFIESGYKKAASPDDIKEGDFFIDNNRIRVLLLPAPYPHHIIGIHGDTKKIVNISITGLSGRSGISIESAQDLCESIGLHDALIFDNGFDVVSQIGGSNGTVIRHAKNTRQTRLTAALHFGRIVENPADERFCGYFDGLDMGYTTIELNKNRP